MKLNKIRGREESDISNLPSKSFLFIVDISTIPVDDDNIGVMCTEVLSSLRVVKGCVVISIGVVSARPSHDNSR